MGKHRPDPLRRRAPLWAQLCTVVGAFLLLGSTGLGAAAYALAERYDNNINRADYLGSVGKDSDPQSTVTGPFNLLLLGSDIRKGTYADPNQGERADTIMLVHVPRGLDRASFISLPRDSWVDVPALDGKWDGGPAKINAAFEIGGVPHVVRTVQQLTGLEMDYVVTIDFEGFKDITDAVGGVDMDVPIAVKSIHTQRSWTKGRHHFTGAEALDYVRQRKQYDNGDFQRIDNQQAFIRALMSKVVSTGRLRNPVALDKLLKVAGDATTVDKRTPVKELAFALKGLRPADLSFTTLPMASYAIRGGGQSVVLVDEAKAQALFAAVQGETLDAWLLANPAKKMG